MQDNSLDGLLDLLDRRHLLQLVTLNVNGCRIGQAGVSRLLTSLLDAPRPAHRLKELGLADNCLEPGDWIRRLFRRAGTGKVLITARESSLRSLDLSYNPLDSGCLRTLSEVMPGSKLKVLKLVSIAPQGCALAPEALERFLLSLEHSNLNKLDLRQGGIEHMHSTRTRLQAVCDRHS